MHRKACRFESCSRHCFAPTTMNELKEKLAALGLSPEQDDGVLKTVADFVKAKLPVEYKGVVDSLLAGETPDFSALGVGLLDKVRGMFS